MKIIKNDGTLYDKFNGCNYLFESTYKGKNIIAAATLHNLLILPLVKLGLKKVIKM